MKAMPTPPVPETINRFAVCVGINQYHSLAQVIPLQHAEADAQALHALLLQKGFVKENCRLLLGAEATREANLESLITFALTKPRSDDLVLFYFAGHGLPIDINDEEDTEPQSEVFLPSYDFDLQRIMHDRGAWLAYPLRMGKLRTEFFEHTRSKKVLFILDSCHSGDFFGSSYRDRDGDNLAYRYIEQPFGKNSAGRVVLSSCLPHQRSRENTQLGHGLFTYHLLEALEGRAPHAIRHDGCVTVGSLFEYLSEKLPSDQRPVKSGVEHDTFKLLCYPKPDEQLIPHLTRVQDAEQKRIEIEHRLKAMMVDNSGFLRDRLSSFVGRQTELKEVRQRIAEKLRTGGYVTITGQAGQGKSSMIAKLVDEYGPENVAFHFIPFNPGPDHQVGLLRNLMARLIFKYQLSDIYVASESRPALRDFFPKALAELVARGGQEVVFIDGLDQLEEELSGVRDLSFLPNNPPQGIAFVLGTRPNDILRPLELLKPHHEYKLPNLSRQDFNLILQRHQVHLNKGLADQFYRLMQENALYLDLIAKELMEKGTNSPQEIIKQLADNPDNIFSLSIERLKRRTAQWEEVIKPILGLLLATREPLAVRHIKQILGVGDDRIRDGIASLGGLITEDRQHRYSLFHLKLRDYLKQDEDNPHKKYIFATDEEEEWHKIIVKWCEKGDITSIWNDADNNTIEQERRVYARWHYITHLYYAVEWQRMFDVLDGGAYGQAKVRDDLGMHSYAQDLELGRQAATWGRLTMEEGIEGLQHLWRYTLLQSSLASRANMYPPAAFRVLVMLKKEQKAVNLAELLTNPIHKVNALLEIARQIGRQLGRGHIDVQILLRAREVAYTIQEGDRRAQALTELEEELARVQMREQTVLAKSEKREDAMDRYDVRTSALRKLGKELAKTHEWEQIEEEIHAILQSREKVKVLVELGEELARAGERERAITVWMKAEAVIRMIQEGWERAEALCELGEALARAGEWGRAEAMIGKIQRSDTNEERENKVRAFCELGEALAGTGEWGMAEAVINEVQWSDMRVGVLGRLGEELAKAGEWERAESVIDTLGRSGEKARALGRLGEELARAGKREQAVKVWMKAEAVIRSLRWSRERAEELCELGEALVRAREWDMAEAVIDAVERSEEKARALGRLGEELARAGKREQAVKVWMKAEAVIHSLQWNAKEEALCELAKALARAGEWERAEAVIDAIEWSENKARALGRLGEELALAKEWEKAEAVIDTIEQIVEKWEGIKMVTDPQREVREEARALGRLGEELARAGKREQAVKVWMKAEAVIHSLQWNAKEEALCELAKALALAGEWERAEAVIDTVKDFWQLQKVLCELGEALALAGEWEKAEAVINTIELEVQKARALKKLVEVLASVHKQEHLLRVVQFSWMQSSTRDYAIRLLPLACVLIPFKPQLGKAFIETFAWVDTFLRRC